MCYNSRFLAVQCTLQSTKSQDQMKTNLDSSLNINRLFEKIDLRPDGLVGRRSHEGSTLIFQIAIVFGPERLSVSQASVSEVKRLSAPQLCPRSRLSE